MYETIDENLEKKFCLTEFPLNISIEVTNHCNLNCIMCNNDKLTRPKGFMSAELYKKIIDETAKESPSSRIWLDFYGEALLAGWKLYFFIDYAKKKGLSNVCINTNGTLMKPEYAEMLIDSGVDYISLDCDGYSKQVYESIRINGNRDAFYSNVEYLIKYKEKKHAHTIIDIKVIEMEQNKHEVEKMVDYWRKRGAWTAVRRCGVWTDKSNNNIIIKDISNQSRIACGHAVGTAAISWDGIVAGCAWDYDCKMSCGKIPEESLKNIWIRRNNEFIKLHMEHRFNELPMMCKECNNWSLIGEERYDENGNPQNRKYGIKDNIYE